MSSQPIPKDPSLPPVPLHGEWLAEHCECALPIPEERATHRGAARTYCVRCDRELPLKFGARGWR